MPLPRLMGAAVRPVRAWPPGGQQQRLINSAQHTPPCSPPCEEPPPMLSSETWVLLRAGAACAILAVVAARIIADRGIKAEDVTIGFLGPSLAALYLLVLAVSLATEWQTIGDANQAITTEASAVRELYWSSAGLGPGHETFVQEHTRAYAMTVVDHDWPEMRRGTLDNASEQQLIVLNHYLPKFY